MDSSLFIIQKQLLSSEQLEEYETYIENLLRQKMILENIEQYTNYRLDFGDLLETRNLLDEEIKRLQCKIRENSSCLPISGERGLEGGEVSSSSILDTKDYLFKYMHHKYILKALNKVLREKECEEKVCGICHSIKPVKEFSTDLICNDCEGLIDLAVEKGKEIF